MGAIYECRRAMLCARQYNTYRRVCGGGRKGVVRKEVSDVRGREGQREPLAGQRLHPEGVVRARKQCPRRTAQAHAQEQGIVVTLAPQRGMQHPAVETRIVPVPARVLHPGRTGAEARQIVVYDDRALARDAPVEVLPGGRRLERGERGEELRVREVVRARRGLPARARDDGEPLLERVERLEERARGRPVVVPCRLYARGGVSTLA